MNEPDASPQASSRTSSESAGASASAPPPSVTDFSARSLRVRSVAWALAPALILGCGLAGLGVMTALAIDDPSFALEPNYYQKAVDLDDEKRQQAQNRDLGWQLELGPAAITDQTGVDLAVTLTSAEGPLDDAAVQVRAFHNARAADVHELALEAVGEGMYRARLADVRPGLWEFRFVVERHGVRFTDVQRRVLQPGGKS